MLNKLQRWILTLCPHSEKSLGPPHHEGFSLGNLSLTCHFISSHQQEHFQVKRQNAKDTCPGSQYRDRAGTQTPRVYVTLKPVLSAPLELMSPREQHTVTLTQGVHSADIWGFRSLRVEQSCCFSSKIGKKIKIVNAYQPLPLGIYMKTKLPARLLAVWNGFVLSRNNRSLRSFTCGSYKPEKPKESVTNDEL